MIERSQADMWWVEELSRVKDNGKARQGKAGQGRWVRGVERQGWLVSALYLDTFRPMPTLPYSTLPYLQHH
jgi:hypothetical protein